MKNGQRKGHILKKSTARAWIGIALLIAIGSIAYKYRDFLGGTFTNSNQSSKKEMDAVSVEAQLVTVRPLVTELVAVGNLVAHDSVILRPETEGIISNILFDSGAYVKKDQTLYTLDDALVKAQLADANAELLVAQKNHSRAQALSKKKFISGKDLDELFAKWEKAKAQVDLAKVRLAKTIIQAPFEGYAGIIHHSRGAFIKAGEDLVTIVALDPMKVDFQVGEEYLQKLQEGQKLTLKVDGFEQTFQGEVEAIEPSVDLSGHSILVRGRIDNHDAKLHPGLFATINLTLNVEKDAILIPESALETQGNEQFVYRVVDGVAVQTPVTVGAFEDGMVHILDGLWSYDTVITAGAIKISDGVLVRVVDGPHVKTDVSLTDEQIESARAILKAQGKDLPAKGEKEALKEEELLKDKEPSLSSKEKSSAPDLTKVVSQDKSLKNPSTEPKKAGE